jgi:hypothetical protein
MRRCFWALGGTLVLLAIGPSAAAAQGPPPITLTGGHVDWGVKLSFRNYIAGPIAHGTITAADGATINPDGTFRFPLVGGTYSLATHGVDARYAGNIHFVGHGGQLDLTIAEPRIVTTGNTGTLYVDATSRGFGSPTVTEYDDVAFATLDLAGSTVTPGATQVSIAPIASALSADGVPAFVSFYTAGTALDPVATTVSFAPPTRPTTPQPSAPAPEVVAEVEPEPVVRVAASRLTSLTRPWNRNRKAAVARVACRTGSCEVDAPSQIRFEVDGERYHPVVIAPERLEQGQRGTVRIRLSRRALAALQGQRATSTLRFTVRSGDSTDWQTLQLTLRGSGLTVG